MATTILLQTLAERPIGSGLSRTIDQTTRVTVARSPGRYYYATIDRVPRTFERVGVDANGHEIYREQRWRTR